MLYLALLHDTRYNYFVQFYSSQRSYIHNYILNDSTTFRSYFIGLDLRDLHFQFIARSIAPNSLQLNLLASFALAVQRHSFYALSGMKEMVFLSQDIEDCLDDLDMKVASTADGIYRLTFKCSDYRSP